jgi:hypothetical protein
MKKIDLTEKRFGRLTVIEQAGSDKWGFALWMCKCDCGVIIIVNGGSLRSGCTKSCGCLQREIAKKRLTTHGLSSSRIYKIWASMIQRCIDINYEDYHYYGGRGITVCKRWKFFENFLADMGECPNDFTLERVDNEKGYFLKNCKWATHTEQNRNQRVQKRNKTGITGVFWSSDRNKFRSYIGVGGRLIHLGSFKELNNAILARQDAEMKYWRKNNYD